MTPNDVAANPKIFHITHVNNLPSILRDGGLWCDSQRIARNLASTNIGHLHIKQRRRQRAVPSSVGGVLGDYVPFNFCPRSVMLYAVARGHDDYADGQQNVVHLVSSVSDAIAIGHPWTFTDRHAELAHTLFFEKLADLKNINWPVMKRVRWVDVKEERQAEFLVHQFFPWSAIAEIATMNVAVANHVRALLPPGDRPVVGVRPEWYY